MPSTPKVTKTTVLNPTTLELDGTNFITSGYTPQLYFGGVKANTVTITSDTKVSAVFTKGVPPVSVAAGPELTFMSLAAATTGLIAQVD